MRNASMLKNKKGFTNLFWALILVVLVSVIAAVFHNFLIQFVALAGTQRASLQNYYYAEFGIYRGKWLLDGRYITVPPTYGPVNFDMDVDGDGTPEANASLRVSENPPGHGSASHIVESEVNGKSLTVKYKDAKIISWD